MMWEISNLHQLFTALFSVALGVVLALIYDIFKAPRILKRKTVFRVFISDIVFGAIATLLTFCLLMLRTKGQLRIFVLVFILAGFLLWRATLSRFFIKFLCFVLKIFSKVSAYFKALLSKGTRKTVKIFKKFEKNLKKGLKGAKELLYNLLRKNTSAQPDDIRQEEI